jgi:hypothetical protein
MAPPNQSNFDDTQAASDAQFDRQSDPYGRTHILVAPPTVAESPSGLAPSAAGKRARDRLQRTSPEEAAGPQVVL